MFISRMSLPRRTFLRGFGATLALPLLDAMVPALSALTATAGKPARRLGFVYVPNGVIHDEWVPASVGAGFELMPTLRPLEAVKSKVLVLTNLAQKQAESFGDGNGDHARGTASWLNGVHPKRTEGAGIQAGTTIDQIAAERLGRETRLPSLELLQGGETLKPSEREINRAAALIEKTLGEFGLPVKVIDFKTGPAVTQYAVEPGFIERAGPDGEARQYKVRVSQISALANDLALALSAPTIRIEAPVPGHSYVGIEVPNRKTFVVGLLCAISIGGLAYLDINPAFHHPSE